MIHIAEDNSSERNVPMNKSSCKKNLLENATQISKQFDNNKRSKSNKQITMKSRGSFSEAGDKDSRNFILIPKKTERAETEVSYSESKRLLSIPGRSRKTDEGSKSVLSQRLNDSILTINELNKMLDGEEKKRLNTENKDGKRVLAENNYGEADPDQTKQEDKEDVRGLDRWRLEIKRKKILNSMNKMSEIMDMYTKKKVKEHNNVPLVNAEALDRIMDESEDEVNTQSSRSASVPTNVREKSRLAYDKSKKAIDGPIMPEDNSDLLTSLIMQKVQKQLNMNDIKKLSKQQLKLEIKMIADSVVMRFKALKKHGSEVLVQNQVENVVKRLKAKISRLDNLATSPNKNQEEGKLSTEEATVDYRMVEVALTKNLEQSVEEVESLSTRIKELNNENFRLKNMLIQNQDQLRQLNKNSKAIVEDKYDSKSSHSPPKGDPKISFLEESGISGDYMKAQKNKHERKKQEAIIKEKISEFEEKLGLVVRERENAENGLKLARDSKIYFRLQLKDLYYQLLKDEKYLMKNKSDASYTWIIKALWRINEEIKDQAFPAFMDIESINFIKELSMSQVEIEKYCKQNNLMGMLSSLDDFKQIYSRAFNQKQKEDEVINTNEVMPQISSARLKDGSEILKEFQDKMYLLKKSNTKAKRLVNVINFNTRGRFFTTKWEDVNPSITSDQLISQNKQKSVEFDSPTHERTKPSKYEFVPTAEILTAPEKVSKMLHDLEVMKRNEINRIIKENVGNALDDRMIANIEKSFLFMFGKGEGNEAFRRFMKEKKVIDDRNLKNSPTSKRSQSQPQSSKVLVTLPSIKGEKTENDPAPESYRATNSNRLFGLNKRSSIMPLKVRAPPLLYDKANLILHVGSSSSRIFAKKSSVS